MLVRRLCEKYNLLPTEVEEMTVDQLAVLVFPEAELLGHLMTLETPAEMDAHGLTRQKSKKDPGGEGASLVQRIRNQKAKEQQPRRKRGRK